MRGMVDPALKEQILEDLEDLPQEDVRDAAAYIHGLKKRHGKPVEPTGRKLLKYVGIWDKQTADEVAKAIEEGCEQVDPDGW